MTTNPPRDVTIRVQHTSGQFSDPRRQHAHDARAIFEHAVDADVWACTGTEAGTSPVNHDLHDLIVAAGHKAGFTVYAHKWGEWVAINRKHLKQVARGFSGPFIPGTTGIDAKHGAHSPRGIAHITAEALHADLGRLTFGSSHWLTHNSIEHTGVTNEAMVDGCAAYGRKYGAGTDLVFLNGDANEDDERRDLFEGNPFTTLADETGRHFATHGRDKHHGARIDFLASWDHDGRVTGQGFRVLDDHDLMLDSDHFLLLGTYAVEQRG